MVEDGWADDMPWLYYKLTLPVFGSGELKRVKFLPGLPSVGCFNVPLGIVSVIFSSTIKLQILVQEVDGHVTQAMLKSKVVK